MNDELAGTVTAKSCPKCGPTYRMIIRENRHTGHLFLGCINYPECWHTEPLPEDIRLRAAGQKGLFDE